MWRTYHSGGRDENQKVSWEHLSWDAMWSGTQSSAAIPSSPSWPVEPVSTNYKPQGTKKKIVFPAIYFITAVLKVTNSGALQPSSREAFPRWKTQGTHAPAQAGAGPRVWRRERKAWRPECVEKGERLHDGASFYLQSDGDPGEGLSGSLLTELHAGGWPCPAGCGGWANRGGRRVRSLNSGHSLSWGILRGNSKWLD